MSRKNDYEEALDELIRVIGLTPDALHFAECYMVLPEHLQRHVTSLMNEYVASQIPQVAEMYDNARRSDQTRMNERIERIQARLHSKPPKGTH